MTEIEEIHGILHKLSKEDFEKVRFYINKITLKAIEFEKSKVKENDSLHSVRLRFNIPNSEVNFAYYSAKAYLDEIGWYMKDDNGDIQRPDVKYLEIDNEA